MKNPVIVFAVSPAEKADFPNQLEICTGAFIALAESCAKVPNPDFLVLKDSVAPYIVFSNQNFFEKDLKEALRMKGVRLEIIGLLCGQSEEIVSRILEDYPEWRSPTDFGRGHFLLYKVQ